ncbi:MAG: ATP-dependent DNA helicase RecQ, partial [Mobilicoccus sp.]|nr:ATP-dependent DNA helicase RecQ [Mobilicoccus sp.]
PGRVIVHADAPEWREYVHGPFARDEPDPAMHEHAVGVLVDWRSHWRRRPDAVVALPAAGRVRTTEALAAHLSDVGRLDRIGITLTPGDGAGERAGGGTEAASWASRLSVDAQDAERLVGRCVLLVVDESSSGWVVTVAGALLRSHGADTVLPLLVHRRP